jgi:hypothetical protein
MGQNNGAKTANDIIQTLNQEVNTPPPVTDIRRAVMPNSKSTKVMDSKTGQYWGTRPNDPYHCACENFENGKCQSCINCNFDCWDLDANPKVQKAKVNGNCPDGIVAMCIVKDAEELGLETHELYNVPKSYDAGGGFIKSAPYVIDEIGSDDAIAGVEENKWRKYFYRYFDDGKFSPGMPKICYEPKQGKTESYAMAGKGDTARAKFATGTRDANKGENAYKSNVDSNVEFGGLYSAVVNRFTFPSGYNYAGSTKLPANKTLKVYSWEPDPDKGCLKPDFTPNYVAAKDETKDQTNVLALGSDNFLFDKDTVAVDKLPCGMFEDAKAAPNDDYRYNTNSEKFFCVDEAIRISKNSDGTDMFTKYTVEMDFPDGTATGDLNIRKCYTCNDTVPPAYCYMVVDGVAKATCGVNGVKSCTDNTKIDKLVAGLLTPRSSANNDDLPVKLPCGCLAQIEGLIAANLPLEYSPQ